MLKVQLKCICKKVLGFGLLPLFELLAELIGKVKLSVAFSLDLVSGVFLSDPDVVDPEGGTQGPWIPPSGPSGHLCGSPTRLSTPLEGQLPTAERSFCPRLNCVAA